MRVNGEREREGKELRFLGPDFPLGTDSSPSLVPVLERGGPKGVSPPLIRSEKGKERERESAC